LCDNNNWTFGDHLNSVRDVVGIDGSVKHFEYDAFGKLLSENSNNTVFAYTGKMRDNVSALQWNINRWYDANVGKWCAEDPVGFWGGDVNVYRYSSGDIITKVDCYGLKTLDTFVLLGEKTQSTIQHDVGPFIRPNNHGNNVSLTISLNEHLDAHGLHDGTHGVNDSKIGETYMSNPVYYCYPKCKSAHDMWGKLAKKYSAEFTIGGILGV
jgi:RHS repeat-associated protein